MYPILTDVVDEAMPVSFSVEPDASPSSIERPEKNAITAIIVAAERIMIESVHTDTD